MAAAPETAVCRRVPHDHSMLWCSRVRQFCKVQKQGSLPRTASTITPHNTASSSLHYLTPRLPHRLCVLTHRMSIECRIALDGNLVAEPLWHRTGRESAFTARAEARRARHHRTALIPSRTGSMNIPSTGTRSAGTGGEAARSLSNSLENTPAIEPDVRSPWVEMMAVSEFLLSRAAVHSNVR